MSKRKKASKLGLVVIVAVGIYFSWTVINQQTQLSKVNSQLNDIQKKIQQQKADNKTLEEQSKNVEDYKNIEKVARERLGWVKPGERVFVDINK